MKTLCFESRELASAFAMCCVEAGVSFEFIGCHTFRVPKKQAKKVARILAAMAEETTVEVSCL